MEAGLAGDTNLYYMALVERGTGNCSADDSGSRRGQPLRSNLAGSWPKEAKDPGLLPRDLADSLGCERQCSAEAAFSQDLFCPSPVPC